MVIGWAAALALVLCAAGSGQEQPQLVWEAQVDGVNILRVHGRSIDLEDRQGLPIQRQRFRFFDRLPDRDQDVRLEVLKGRGRVRIIEQPRIQNNYTMAVAIEDRQGGSSSYSLAFYWDAAPGFFRRRPQGFSSRDRGEGVEWSGRVDGEAIVSCRAGDCEAQAIRGAPVTRERFNFSRPLPARNLVLSLDRADGRGEIRLIQQPREENGYTARVQIRDSQGGAGDYSFSLVWTRPPHDDAGFSFARAGMFWSGRVDGRLRVVVEGGRAHSEVISGAPIIGERADFSRSLPARNNPNATVRKVRGRGRVEIVEYPSARNGYRLVFEIADSDGGADNYEIEVGW